MKEIAHSDGQLPENIGVANPYALADLVVGKEVSWDKVENRRALLAEILERPYVELFDPIHQSPLYCGLELDEEMCIKKVDPRTLEVQVPDDMTDEEMLDAFQQDPDLSTLNTLSDLKNYIKNRTLQEVEILNPNIVQPGTLRFEVRLTNIPSSQITFPAAAASFQSLMASPEARDWNPNGVVWSDPGTFFKEGTEFSDPVQGAVGDCYLIAALASVAWADPYCIAQRNRVIGSSQQSFVNMIQFYQSPGAAATKIEVSENLPLKSGTGRYIYCRSSERGEIWPAVYEKAYAKWKTADNSDHPNITSIAGGDMVRAISEMTGKRRYYYSTQSHSSNGLWSLVRSNSRSYKTFNPMVAWTYPSGAVSPDRVTYSDANLVANHAYSILGWAYRNNQKYIVLRNPWGRTEASIDTLSGYWRAYDISWWRPIRLTSPDGVFALKASTFKRYFAGLGTAK